MVNIGRLAVDSHLTIGQQPSGIAVVFHDQSSVDQWVYVNVQLSGSRYISWLMTEN